MFVLYILTFGLLLALLEIEIEGENGWAKALPTWRKNKTNAIFGFLRNMTGYHLVLSIMNIFLIHIVYVGIFGWNNFMDELLIIAFYLFLTIYWDFLWFVLNPHFTWKKFRKEHIPWYTDSYWIMGFPVDYWYTLAGSALLAIFVYIRIGYDLPVEQYMQTFIGGIVLWIGLALASPLYHRWYHFMRR